MSLVSPCIYPRCDDGNGDPVLTRDGVCEACHRRYTKLLGWLVEDYATVKAVMPSPVSNGSPVRTAASAARTFGHPAEWASDMAARIADQLNWVEDGLRDELGDDPPVHPRALEAHRVARARHYLVNHMDALCTYSAARDTAVELVELHGQVRAGLGQTRFAQRLPTPCPNCGTAALMRTVGRIECGGCTSVIREEHYPFLTRLVIDELIRDHDAREIREAFVAAYPGEDTPKITQVAERVG